LAYSWRCTTISIAFATSCLGAWFVPLNFTFEQNTCSINLPLPMSCCKKNPNHLTSLYITLVGGNARVAWHKIPRPCKLKLPITSIRPHYVVRWLESSPYKKCQCNKNACCTNKVSWLKSSKT
jgi:hypothetical protein